MLDDPEVEETNDTVIPPKEEAIPPTRRSAKWEIPDGYDPMLDPSVKKARDVWAREQQKEKDRADKLQVDLDDLQDKIDAFGNADKSEREKLQIEIDKLRTKVSKSEDTATAAVARANAAEKKYLRHRVAAEEGLPSKLIRYVEGDTEEEIRDSVSEVKENFSGAGSSSVIDKKPKEVEEPINGGSKGKPVSKETAQGYLNTLSAEALDKLVEEAKQRQAGRKDSTGDPSGHGKGNGSGASGAKIWKKSEIDALSPEAYKTNRAEITAARADGRVIDG